MIHVGWRKTSGPTCNEMQCKNTIKIDLKKNVANIACLDYGKLRAMMNGNASNSREALGG